jgi:3'-5' exoribonuclease
MCDLYPELDREILLVAAVLHDLGKVWEFEGMLSADYTDSGRLLGHIVLGLEILEPFLVKSDLSPDLKQHLKHMIISHHGEYEFGSPKRPKTLEAMTLHYADMMDAKLKTTRSALQELGQESGRWSAYQRSLQRYLYQAESTPSYDKTADKKSQKNKNKKSIQEYQCLLPLKE